MCEVRILEQSETNEKARSAKWLTCLIEAVILGLAILLIAMVRLSWLEPSGVTSDSMENTLKVGEKFLIDHRKSLSGTWKRGDIVLIETTNEQWGEDTLVKRVIGLPGETVEVVNGQVMVNAKALTENYLKEAADDEAVPPVVLDKGQYYVMGDNRNNSGDSRQYGPVSNVEIRGRVTRKFWPMEAIPKPNYSE